MRPTMRAVWASGIALLIALTLAACGNPATLDSNAATSASPSSTSAPASASASPSPASAADSTTATVSASSKLNLNTVTEDQLLATIPNFPNRMVHEFMEYRPYANIQQFRKEIGKYVSAEQVAAWEQYVYVPVDVNASDATTLQQLPGVDATIAEQLIAGRPYQSNDAFLAKLAQYVSPDQVAVARSYLVTQ